MRTLDTRILGVAIAALCLVALNGGQGAAAVASSRSPTSAEPRLITVTGEAEVKVVPDEVIMTLGVETADTNLAVAKSKNDEIVARILAAAAKSGVATKDIRTDYLSIDPRYQDSYERRTVTGYVVRNSLVVTLKDIPAFEGLLTGVLEAGATHVHGIDFRTTELRKHRDTARALAIKAAREKATAMAGELSQTIGQPHEIREEYSGWWSWYGSWWGSRYSSMTQNVTQSSGSSAPQTEGAIAPGEISVTARVAVSFELK